MCLSDPWYRTVPISRYHMTHATQQKLWLRYFGRMHNAESKAHPPTEPRGRHDSRLLTAPAVITYRGGK